MSFNVGDKVRIRFDKMTALHHEYSLEGMTGTVVPAIISSAPFDVLVDFNGSIYGFSTDQLVRVEKLLRKTDSPIDQIIAKYAGELRDVYDKRSAGDMTFTGVLAEFMVDLKERYDLYLK